MEYRAVDICEQIASVEAIELAIKYAGRANKRALVNKLQSIADTKEQKKEEENVVDHHDNFTNDSDTNSLTINEEEIDDISSPIIKKPNVEIKPLAMSQTLKRINPFLKAGNMSLAPRGNSRLFFLCFVFLKNILLLKLFIYFAILQQV